MKYHFIVPILKSKQEVVGRDHRKIFNIRIWGVAERATQIGLRQSCLQPPDLINLIIIHMQTGSLNNSNFSKSNQTPLNYWINATASDADQSQPFFIPMIKFINRTFVPSTPYNSKDGSPIFMGDIIKIQYNESETEMLLVTLKNGQYSGINTTHNMEEPLWLFDPEMIEVLGNSVEKPDLLIQLTK